METRSAILSLLLSAALCVSGDEAFVHYQSIVDKQPFGKKPPEGDVIQVPAAGSFAETMRLSMLFQGADGLPWAGIIDQSSGKNYILKLEDTQDGLELISADMESAEAVIRKGHETVLLSLESGSPKPGLKSPVQTAHEVRIRELSRPVRIQAPEPAPSGEAFRKYIESGQMEALCRSPGKSVQETSLSE